MQFLRSLEHASAPSVSKELHSGAVVGVTIGNFDGMHLGHQALFEVLNRQSERVARAEGKVALKVLLTFAPHPRLVLSGKRKEDWNQDQEYWLLTSLSEKIILAKRWGFDYFLRVKFTSDFAKISPYDFLSECLKKTLNVSTVVVGEDWSFGRSAVGGREELSTIASTLGFDVHIVPPVLVDGQRVSTSAVKKALLQGNLAQVKMLLGRNFELSGKVQHGLKRGRELGFPTANLRLRRALLPPDGVYAVLMRWGSRLYPAVTNIGYRPTFGNFTDHLIETHVIDQSEPLDLYGERIQIEFVSRLRMEKAYPCAEELTSQISRDILEARHVLAPYLQI